MPDMQKWTRRAWLTLNAILETECSPGAAQEAVSSVAIEHPEWDMDEEKTLDEWEATR